MSKSCVSRDQDFDCVSLILDTFLGLPFLRTIRDHKNHKFRSMNQSDFHTNVFIQNFLVDMLGSVPPSILSSEYWNDIDATTFRIRGKNYIADRVKVTSAPAVFKLIAIDVSGKNSSHFLDHT